MSRAQVRRRRRIARINARSNYYPHGEHGHFGTGPGSAKTEVAPPTSGMAQVSERGWVASDDGKVHVFHGTSTSAAAQIEKTGLTTPPSASQGWLMVTTNPEQAAAYAPSDQHLEAYDLGQRAVVEFAIPVGVVDDYLGAPSFHDVYDTQGTAGALLQRQLPASFVVGVETLRYNPNHDETGKFASGGVSTQPPLHATLGQPQPAWNASQEVKDKFNAMAAKAGLATQHTDYIAAPGSYVTGSLHVEGVTATDDGGHDFVKVGESSGIPVWQFSEAAAMNPYNPNAVVPGAPEPEAPGITTEMLADLHDGVSSKNEWYDKYGTTPAGMAYSGAITSWSGYESGNIAKDLADGVPETKSAAAIADALDHAVPINDDLYRGMGPLGTGAVLASTGRGAVSELQPGDTFSLRPSSFSTSETKAQEFLSALPETKIDETHAAYQQAMLHVEPGAKVAPVFGLGLSSEHEVITAGTFQVVAKPEVAVTSQYVGSDGVQYSTTRYTIPVKQVA